MLKSWLEGRALLMEEIPKELQDELAVEVKKSTVQTSTGFEINGKKLSCTRCSASRIDQRFYGPCPCKKTCFYCVECLQMGKVSQCSTLYWFPSQHRPTCSSSSSFLAWAGTLSPQQMVASKEIVEAVEEARTHIVWAVAGAGKTEMLFQGIDLALRQGKRVCIASPRVDVCLELAPRIAAAFPSVPLAVLHGSMETPYSYTSLVIATTHQLLRFKQAFDLLVIDEVDAFPFHLNESLAYGAEKAKKAKSTLLYLSATPDSKLQKEIRTGRVTASVLPARYHGHALPVPQCKWAGNWRKDGLRGSSYSPVIQAIQKWLSMERRFLVFVPNIEWMRDFERVCTLKFPDVSFAAVSSEDPDRKEKVMTMRNEGYKFLITTTILERGVTFPNIHVLVIGAEDDTFTEAALVQISGRAGRSPLFPKGEVLFLHQGKTSAIKKAIRQIERMNTLATRKGYIFHE